MRHPFSTNVHGVSFMCESVFASKFPLRKTVPGHMPLIPHAKPMRNAVASASESSTVACLANAMVPTNVVSDEIKDANAHTETITAVSQPFATSAAYMVHAKAPLRRARRTHRSEKATGPHFAGGEFQGSFPVAAHESSVFHQELLLDAPLLTHPWPELPAGCCWYGAPFPPFLAPPCL